MKYDDQASLIEVLHQQGMVLVDTPNDKRPEALPLRKVQEFLDDWPQSFSSDSDLRFLVFFLSILLDTFFYNLSGDAPYEKGVDKERSSILRGFGRIMIEIAEALQQEDHNRCYRGCVDLVVRYLDGIDEVNRIINECVERKPLGF